jgi:hypothetical protein
MPDRDLSSLSNVDPERLSRLWPQAGPPRARNGNPVAHPAHASQPEPADVQWEPAELEDVLRHQLAAPFEFGEADDGDALRFTATAPGAPPAPRRGSTLAALLSDPSPQIEALRRAKEWAKPAMHGHADDLPREVAGVIYFAAIHAALSRGGERITHLTDGALRKGARWALRRPWLDPLCAAVFGEGLAHLEAGGTELQE